MTLGLDPYALLQAVWILTLWLAMPFLFAIVTRHRDAKLARSVGRVALLGAPLVVVIALFSASRFQPLIDMTTRDAARRSVATAPVEWDISRDDPSTAADDSVDAAWRSILASYDANPSAAMLPEFESHAQLAPSDFPLGEVVASDSPLGDRIRGHANSEDATDGDSAFASSMFGTPPPGEFDDASSLATDSTPTTFVPAAPASSFRSTATIRNWLVVIWAVVTLLGLHRIFSAKRGLDRLRAGWLPVPADVHRHIARLATHIGYRRRFEAFRADALGEAVATGWLRGALAVPSRWLASLREEEMTPLMVHELAHLKGRDPLWRALSWLACTILWPHPLVHALARREAALCETIADQEVLAAGADRYGYAATLGRLAEQRASAHRALAIAPGALGTRNSLEGRIRMILDPTPTSTRRVFRPVALSVLVASTLLIVVGIANPLIGASQSSDDRRNEIIRKLEETLAERDAQLVNAQNHIAQLTMRIDQMALEMAKSRAGMERNEMQRDAQRRDVEARALAQAHDAKARNHAMDLKNAVERHQRELRVAEVRLEAAEARWKIRQEQLEQTEAKAESGIASRQEINIAKLELIESRADLEVSRAELENLHAELQAMSDRRNAVETERRDMNRAREAALKRHAEVEAQAEQHRAHREAILRELRGRELQTRESALEDEYLHLREIEEAQRRGNERAKKAYDRGEYQRAIEEYRKATEKRAEPRRLQELAESVADGEQRLATVHDKLAAMKARFKEQRGKVNERAVQEMTVEVDRLTADLETRRRAYERAMKQSRQSKMDTLRALEIREFQKRGSEKNSQRRSSVDDVQQELRDHINALRQREAEMSKKLEQLLREGKYDEARSNYDRARQHLDRAQGQRNELSTKLREAVRLEMDAANTQLDRSARRDAKRSIELHRRVLDQRQLELDKKNSQRRNEIEKRVHEELRRLELEQRDVQKRLELERATIEADHSRLEESVLKEEHTRQADLERDLVARERALELQARESHLLLEESASLSHTIQERLESAMRLYEERKMKSPDKQHRSSRSDVRIQDLLSAAEKSYAENVQTLNPQRRDAIEKTLRVLKEAVDRHEQGSTTESQLEIEYGDMMRLYQDTVRQLERDSESKAKSRKPKKASTKREEVLAPAAETASEVSSEREIRELDAEINSLRQDVEATRVEAEAVKKARSVSETEPSSAGKES